MIIIKKTFLPDIFRYNGWEYRLHPEATAAFDANPWSWEATDKWYDKGLRPLLIEVLSRNLKGKLDANNKPYQPQRYVFTISEEAVKWKVVLISRKSDSREIVDKNLTREEAQRMCLSIKPTNIRTAHCFIQK